MEEKQEWVVECDGKETIYDTKDDAIGAVGEIIEGDTGLDLHEHSAPEGMNIWEIGRKTIVGSGTQDNPKEKEAIIYRRK